MSLQPGPAIFQRLRPDPVFVDTGAWVAVRILEDAHSHTAQEAMRRLVLMSRPLVTTNLVVGETYTLLRSRRGFDAAWGFLELLDRTRRLVRYRVSSEIENDAYSILRHYRDHDFSFVDATSFAFMRSAGISEAFAFDAHFATAGFTRIPLDPPIE